MSFEENFPSLNEDSLNEAAIYYKQIAEGYIAIPKIIKNCLDKQKVREAIMKLINKRPSGNLEIDAYINGIQLLKELGLDKKVNEE